MSCNKYVSRRVPIQRYFEKIGIERKITEYLDSRSAKCLVTNLGSWRVPTQHYFEKTLEPKGKPMNIF